jgi:hypothetical protein
VRPDDQEAWWLALPQALATPSMSCSPSSSAPSAIRSTTLPGNEGDYVWIVDQWTTEGPKADLFGPLEPFGACQNHDYLDDLSGYWVRMADLDSFHR